MQEQLETVISAPMAARLGRTCLRPTELILVLAEHKGCLLNMEVLAKRSMVHNTETGSLGAGTRRVRQGHRAERGRKGLLRIGAKT